MSDRDDTQNDGRTIHVSQLPGRTKEDEIRKMFATCGKVESCKLIVDPKTGQSRYFAFVTMSTDEAADEAIAKFDQTMVDGRKINVAKAKRGRERSPTPGEYLGLNKSRGFQRDRFPDRRDRDFDRRDRDRDFDRRDRDFERRDERRDDRRDFERRDDRRDVRDRDVDLRDNRGFERRDRGFDYREDRRDRVSPRNDRRDRVSPRDDGRDRGYGFDRERGLSPRGYAPPPPPRRPYSPNRFDPREDRYRGGSPPRDYEPERIRDREQDRDRDRDRRRN